MSNYLSNLIARTTATAAVVQPRPLSLYEPVAPNHHMQLYPEEVATTGNELPVRPPGVTAAPMETPPLTSAPGTPLSSPVPTADPAPPPTRAASAGPAPAAQPAAPPAPPARITATIQPNIRAEEVINLVAAVSARQQPDPGTTGVTPAIEEPGQERQAAFGPVLRRPIEERPPAREIAMPQAATKMAPATGARTSVQPLVSFLTAPPPGQVRPAEQTAYPPGAIVPEQAQIIERTTFGRRGHVPDLPRVQNKPAMPSQPAPALLPRPITATITGPILPAISPGDARPAAVEASPAPTIQVHIGRIEVRAAPPAPAPPKQQRQPPVMTLDDYLRRRNGQGQRDE